MGILLLAMLIGARQRGKEDHHEAGGNGNMGQDSRGDAQVAVAENKEGDNEASSADAKQSRKEPDKISP